MAILLAIIGPAAVIGAGDTVFSTENSYDIDHITAENQDAFMLAIEDTRPKKVYS